MQKVIKLLISNRQGIKNKMGIDNEIELAKEEERITKLKAIELFETGKLNKF